jgi:hypothetical protein
MKRIKIVYVGTLTDLARMFEPDDDLGLDRRTKDHNLDRVTY